MEHRESDAGRAQAAFLYDELREVLVGAEASNAAVVLTDEGSLVGRAGEAEVDGVKYSVHVAEIMAQDGGCYFLEATYDGGVKRVGLDMYPDLSRMDEQAGHDLAHMRRILSATEFDDEATELLEEDLRRRHDGPTAEAA